jgi:bacillopeptidase F (M6 metalloprotease family)
MLQFFKGVSTISIYVQGAFGNTTGEHPQSVFSGVIDAPNSRCDKREKACGTEKRMVFYKIIKLTLHNQYPLFIADANSVSVSSVRAKKAVSLKPQGDKWQRKNFPQHRP